MPVPIPSPRTPKPALSASSLLLLACLCVPGCSRRPAFPVLWSRSFPREAVASGAAGDLKRDGFSDLALGVGGRLEVYYGTSRGLPPGPDWTWRPDGNGLTGACVAVLGRLGSSPYPVLASSSPADGRVYLFRCGPRGVEPEPWRVLRAPGKHYDFGERLVDAGDLYGDGYHCLAVADYAYGFGRGAVYVYRGGPQGPGPLPVWKAFGGHAGDWFGYSLCGPGDLDGSGFDDLVIGSKNCDGTCLNFLSGESSVRLPAALRDPGAWGRAALLPRAGRVSVYDGSRSGPGASPALVVEGTSPSEMFGYSLAPGGRDAQGRGRLLVGSLGWKGRRGLVQLFEEEPRRAGLKPLWSVEGDGSEQGFGDLVQAWFQGGQVRALVVAGVAKGCAWVLEPQGPGGAPWKRPLFSDPPVEEHLNGVLGWGGDFWGQRGQQVYVWVPGAVQSVKVLKII